MIVNACWGTLKKRWQSKGPSLRTSSTSYAGRHHGHVPLHGRLFMQWLHHAYPRDCPYPHASGTINPVTQDEWLTIHADLEDAMATDAEREQHATKHVPDLASLESLPWTDVEELVA